MGMTCSICSHIKRLEIDKLICSGQSKSEIARRYALPEYSVRNHALKHLSKALIKSQKAKDLLNADALMDEAL